MALTEALNEFTVDYNYAFEVDNWRTLAYREAIVASLYFNLILFSFTTQNNYYEKRHGSMNKSVLFIELELSLYPYVEL